MSAPVCYRCRVHGKVQGVFFRASTARQARSLGVTGHAINLPDGTVEVLCYGLPDAVDALRAWLKEGPPMARVARVECERVEGAVRPEGFSTG